MGKNDQEIEECTVKKEGNRVLALQVEGAAQDDKVEKRKKETVEATRQIEEPGDQGCVSQ